MRRLCFSCLVILGCSSRVSGADGTDGSSGETEACVVGQVACDCTPGGGCDPGLQCIVGVCIPDDGGSSTSPTQPTDSSDVASATLDTGVDSLESSSESGASSTDVPDDCGNDRLDPGEACDDGNTITGDGCNADCQPGGQEIWTVLLDGGEQRNDEAHGVAVDADGDIYVAGWANSAYMFPSDALIVKLDDDGQEQWTDVFTSGMDAGDAFWGVAVLPDQSVVVSGWHVINGNQQEAMVRAYSEDGAVLWDYFEPDIGNSTAYDVAVDSAGNVVVTGYVHDAMDGTVQTWLAKLTGDGDIVWNYRLDVPSLTGTTALAVDSDDAIVICGVQSYGYVRKLDPDGQELWTWSDLLGGNAQFFGIDTDADDGIFVAGVAPGQLDTWFAHHPADGIDPDWMDGWNGNFGGAANAWDVAVDSGGRTIWVGDETSAMSDRYVFARKLDTDGTAVWTDEVMGLSTGYDIPFSIAVDADDNPIYVGRQRQDDGNDDIFIRKLTP